VNRPIHLFGPERDEGHRAQRHIAPGPSPRSRRLVPRQETSRRPPGTQGPRGQDRAGQLTPRRRPPGRPHARHRRYRSRLQPGESSCSTRRGSGPGPPGPAGPPGACHSSPPPVSRSAGRTRRAPATCWCARTTVESALSVQSFPRPHRSQPAACPGCPARSRHPTSGDAGYRRSSVPEPLRQVAPRAPVRVRKKIPLITIRWFSHRPPRGGSAGRKPRNWSLSSSVRS
jgi:hypothetical protein